MSVTQSEDVAGLPRLWVGVRRRHLTLLVLAGLAQALVAGLSAYMLVQALHGSAALQHHWILFAVLVAAASTIGLLRMAERIIAERLSQQYVHEIRVGLIRRNLNQGQVKSLGVAVARTTNDLSSVKSWISQGVAPLAVGAPLMLGACVVLFVLDPVLSLGLIVPLALLAVGLSVLTPIAYQRARALRRARGKLAGQIADTILSTTAIRSSGGSTRELGRIDRYSSNLVQAAVHRAKMAGALRGIAVTASGITTASVVGTGLVAGLPVSHIVAALTVSGFLATPIHDVGRAAEFRQTYRAARRIIGPAIDPNPSADELDAAARPGGVQSIDLDSAGEGVIADGLATGDGTLMPRLMAWPGDRVVLEAGSKQSATEILNQFAGLRPISPGQVWVQGTDLGIASPGRMRRRVGYGARGMMLARTSITRAVSYRSSEVLESEATRLLGLVGLLERVNELPKGDKTVLYHGGEPLSIPERARLTLARAILNDPPLLVFDHLDSDLGRDGRAMMRQLLRSYPGVVIVASDTPEEVIEPTLRWRVGRTDMVEFSKPDTHQRTEPRDSAHRLPR